MPQMTGDEMAIAMLDKRPDLPIIICTGYSEKLTLESAEKIGIKRVMKKPVDLHELLEQVAAELKQKEYS